MFEDAKFWHGVDVDIFDDMGFVEGREVDISVDDVFEVEAKGIVDLVVLAIEQV